MTKKQKAEDARVLGMVREALELYAGVYCLRLRSVELLRGSNTVFGRCYSDGSIFITVRWKNGKQVLPYSLLDTMAHELAHLRYFSHSPRWMRLHATLLQAMVRGHVYQKARKLIKRKS